MNKVFLVVSDPERIRGKNVHLAPIRPVTVFRSQVVPTEPPTSSIARDTNIKMWIVTKRTRCFARLRGRLRFRSRC